MFAFGVYAANQVSVTTSGTVTFTADNVNATVSRTVNGCDEAKSTFGNGSKTYIQQINNSTTPEEAEDWFGQGVSGLFSIGTNLYLNGEHIVDIEIELNSEHCLTFSGVNSLRSIVIKNYTGGSYPFAHCKNLSYVEFSEGVAELTAYGTFCYAYFKTVKLPSTLTSISDEFFYNENGSEREDIKYIFAGTVEQWTELTADLYVKYYLSVECSDGMFVKREFED